MKLFSKLMVAVTLIFTVFTAPAFAGDSDPLFISLTTDDSHRANMAVSFGKNQLNLGHPLTVFLNDKGVMVASKANAAEFAEHHKKLAAIIKDGGQVLVCPMCMKHFGIQKTDLLAGLQVGNPELTGRALFKENTKTLNW